MPGLAMLTVGWTSRGIFQTITFPWLSFFGLAIVWGGEAGARSARLRPLALVQLIWMAQSLGLFWFVGAAGYITLARPRQAAADFPPCLGGCGSITILGRTVNYFSTGGA